MPNLKALVAAAAAAVVAAVGLTLVTDSDDYEIKFMMESFNSAYEGANVTIAGQTVGTIESVEVKDGQALVTASVDESHAPLHAGTQGRLAWRNAIGARTLELQPGDEGNPELPSGKIIQATTERVELDDLLATLDGETREDVKQTVSGLQQTLDGSEKDLNRTLETGGPLVAALGEVLRGVGEDGPAIRSLVTDLRELTSRANARDQKGRESIRELSKLVDAAAQQQAQVTTALDDVPSTLEAGTRFFEAVPSAVDQAIPLIEDLEPATRQLPATAKRLNPVLQDLRPTVDELRPTLSAARELLGVTPNLLDMGAATVPDVTQTLDQLQPAVSFLRPYTAETIGFLSNWTSLFSAKNSAGHFGRALVPASATSFNSNPTGIIPPGISQWQAPAPGANAEVAAGRTVDANGDAIR